MSLGRPGHGEMGELFGFSDTLTVVEPRGASDGSVAALCLSSCFGEKME